VRFFHNGVTFMDLTFSGGQNMMKLNRILAISLVVAIGLLVVPAIQVKADYDTAYNLYKAKKYSEAIPLLEEWCNKYPKDPRGGYTLAQCYVKTKQNAKALQRLQIVLEHHPDHSPSQFLMGMLTLGDSPEKALPHFKSAVEASPDNGTYHYYYGSALMAAKKYNEAIPALKQAVQINPKDGRAQLDLGKVLLLADKPQEAVKHLEIASKGKKDKDSALYYLGLAHLQTKDYAAAETALGSAAQINPKDDKILYNLGLAREGALGGTAGSVDACQPMIDAYGQAVTLDPGNADYQMRLGNAYEIAARSIYEKTAGNQGLSSQAIDLLENARKAYAVAVAADAGSPAGDRISGVEQMIENIKNPQIIEEEVHQ